MGIRRIAAIAVSVALVGLASASTAEAQVCMGIPATDGQMSLQGEVFTRGSSTSYGGRLGMNFNTEFSVDVSVRRPETEDGVAVGGRIAYEMEEYSPPVCFLFGVQHSRRTLTDGEEETETAIPIGLGIGKRLGSAKSLSLALFVLPEYLYVLQPEPVGEYDGFWDELGERSRGRGVIGLLIASPFIYATGSVEITTLDDFEPTFSVGLGLTF